MAKLLIKNIAQLVTCAGEYPRCGSRMDELGIINDAAVISENGKITFVGTTDQSLALTGEDECEIIDATGRCVLPGFIDCHTHFIFAGQRAEEFSWRLQGVPYMEIMQRGGGIINTVAATRRTGVDELFNLGMKRLQAMLELGVTTVEGKSGYGLDKDNELKQLMVMRLLNDAQPVDIIPTFMGAHAIPAEYKGRTDEFIEYLAQVVLPAVQEQNIAEFCDVFCEQGVFDIAQSERLLSAAKERGLKLKLHADEIVRIGGAELAASLGAVSADHLLQVSDAGIEALAKAGTVAVLLPATAFSLREPYARARAMIDAGVAVAVASDFNPGSCCTYSIPLIIALSSLYMGLTPAETITALTINAAAAIGRAGSIGSIEVGKQADMVIIEQPDYRYLSYYIGINLVEKVIKRGKVVIQKNRSPES